jgi:hypothetical protein
MAGKFCEIRALAIASKRHEKAANLHLDGLKTMENTAHQIGNNLTQVFRIYWLKQNFAVSE